MEEIPVLDRSFSFEYDPTGRQASAAMEDVIATFPAELLAELGDKLNTFERLHSWATHADKWTGTYWGEAIAVLNALEPFTKEKVRQAADSALKALRVCMWHVERSDARGFRPPRGVVETHLSLSSLSPLTGMSDSGTLRKFAVHYDGRALDVSFGLTSGETFSARLVRLDIFEKCFMLFTLQADDRNEPLRLPGDGATVRAMDPALVAATVEVCEASSEGGESRLNPLAVAAEMAEAGFAALDSAQREVLSALAAGWDRPPADLVHSARGVLVNA